MAVTFTMSAANNARRRTYLPLLRCGKSAAEAWRWASGRPAVKLWAFTALFAVSMAVLADKVEDQTVLVEAEDREMNAAIAQARATLGQFLKIVAHPPEGASGFKLKVKVTDSHGTEHFWVIPFHETTTGFDGTVANDATYVKSVAYGDKISFSRADITDWGYILDGKQKGSFTVCVLFKHMPPAEVKQYRDDHGFEC